MAERSREQAARARALRRFVLQLIDDLAEAAGTPRPWSEHAAWAERWLLDLLGPVSRRVGWPDAEHKAAERVEVALRRLAALDDVEGPVALEVFARTLAVELEADLGRVGRFGEGVLVGSVEMGIGLDLDLLVVLGLAEGSFPATVRDDSLLPDRERLAADGELELRAARVERQHRHLLGSLAGAARQLLCVPRGDLRRSAERVPSRWVLDLAAALAGSGSPWWGKDLLEARTGWVHHVASFDAGLRHAPEPATPQEHRLVSLLAAGGRLGDADDLRTRAGAEVVRARRSAAFTRFDGNVGGAGLAIPSPVGSLTSPTRLERWASCPLSYLVEDVLRAAPVENPEDELEISALERGSLVHQVLEDFIGEVLDRSPSDRPGPMQPWTAADHQRIEALGRARCDEWQARGLTGRPIFWRRDRRRILADLHEFLDRDSAHRGARHTSPVAAELGFGFDGEAPAVELPLPDGRTLRFRGRADRLDESADGSLHVIDYKTGGSRGYTGLSGGDPVLGGTKLQLPVYGLAARAHRGHAHTPVHAEYWFVTTKGEFRHIGYDVTDDVLEHTRGVLAAIVEGIEAGRFPAHPDGSSTNVFVPCDTCDPDGLGTVDLRRQWERKRSDPALAPYAQQVEPLDGEEART
jgi:RecB family exonuclease